MPSLSLTFCAGTCTGLTIHAALAGIAARSAVCSVRLQVSLAACAALGTAGKAWLTTARPSFALVAGGASGVAGAAVLGAGLEVHTTGHALAVAA